MRYPKDHKNQVRQQLLLRSGSHAKKHGFSASGVDALAGAAGLTTGSLYKHFDNKSALFSALVQAELAQTVRRFATLQAADNTAVLAALGNYLSMAHVACPENGCPVPSLAAEVARSGDDIKTAFEAGVLEFKEVLKQHITGSDETAWVLMAQNVGAVMIARAMQNESTQRAILAAVGAHAAQLLVKAAENP
jgi:AcrR family transcriptional regulator